MAILTFISSAWLVAPGCRPYDRPIAPQPLQPAVDPRVTTEGLVMSVERPRPEDAQAYVHVLIRPGGSEPVRLVLGPGWYLDREGLRFVPQQVVSVQGRRQLRGGQPEIVVEQLTTENRRYRLRDEQARPAWEP